MALNLFWFPSRTSTSSPPFSTNRRYLNPILFDFVLYSTTSTHSEVDTMATPDLRSSDVLNPRGDLELIVGKGKKIFLVHSRTMARSSRDLECDALQALPR